MRTDIPPFQCAWHLQRNYRRSMPNTGTLRSIGYKKVTKQVFSTAYVKRGAKYGPGVV
jgi:hypothetical protein